MSPRRAERWRCSQEAEETKRPPRPCFRITWWGGEEGGDEGDDGEETDQKRRRGLRLLL